MQLSVIIVNYNVKYFLEQCLSSVCQATKTLEAEIWVVDNASTDGSIDYLQERFPQVHFIYNEKNVGFAQANNQALFKCTGELVLFLNPDTIVEEDCFIKCISFFNVTPNAGAIGIRMVDGQGIFLPESKRSFPSPLISFFKLVGLTSLFPASKIFARYTLGYLNQHQNHEVDVLAGAFLMGRKDLLLQLKGFDETFFMYGEDVDLSYRMQQTGFKNYYFSGSTIIHFKGESTKKGSLNYVKMFYQAMSIFVKKHYGGGKASLFGFLIQLAIWLRASLSVFKGVVQKAGLPLVDALVIYGSFQLVNIFWVKLVRQGQSFNTSMVNIAFPVFTMLFVFAAYMAGMYDRKYKPSQAFYAALLAIVVMLAGYSLLPENFRFSRGVILFSGVLATLLIVLFRWLLLRLNVVDDYEEENKHEQTLVIGTLTEFEQVSKLLAKAGVEKRILGRIAVNDYKENTLASLENLDELLKSLRIRELIFCEGHLSYKTIISQIQHLPGHINVRFHSKNTLSIVGSDSKGGLGESVSHDGFYELGLPVQKRRKRIIDITMALVIIATFPLHAILSGPQIIYRAVLVLIGKNTWIGYAHHTNKLPHLRPGLLATNGYLINAQSPFKEASQIKIDEWYARNYHWVQDVRLVISNYKKLGSNK